MKKFFKQLFCKHRNSTWVRDIYGDEINHCNGMRSWWVCDNCGKYTLGEWLKEAP